MLRSETEGILELMTQGRHEEVVLWSEPEVGYRGIIAIHDTTMGPALGGTRFWNYKSERAAVLDALRLSRGMTYKAAISGLKLGGGKSVIWSEGHNGNREEIFHAHGRAVESLKGRYITAEDVGTSPEDMEFVAKETNYVVGLPGSCGDGSPSMCSTSTALGVCHGIKACAAQRYGTSDLSSRHVAIQGLGAVGYNVCKNLVTQGAQITVTDLDTRRVQRVVREFGAEVVEPEAIYDVCADIFAPCALGAVINDETINRLNFDIVAGSANNQLAQSQVHGTALHEGGILYAPDYVINAGGLINVYGELHGWSTEQIKDKVTGIYDTLLWIFGLAESEGIPSHEVANEVAESRIVDARALLEKR